MNFSVCLSELFVFSTSTHPRQRLSAFFLTPLSVIVIICETPLPPFAADILSLTKIFDDLSGVFTYTHSGNIKDR